MNETLPNTHEPARTHWLAIGAALLALMALFVWLYARFAASLHFGMDDYIETEAALAKPLGTVIGDFFAGRMSWSGYRPVAYSVRAALAHQFGAQQVTGYYLFSLCLHFANTLLLFHLIWRVARWVLPAFAGALFFLLLPSHNEAVLYMSASANLMALFLALLTLESSLTLPLAEAHGRQISGVVRWLLIAAAAVAYWLAILAYEVTLPLVALILLADFAITRASQRVEVGAFVRRRAALYVALGSAAALALAMRLWAGGGVLGPERSDYGVSFAPDHLLRGYAMLFSQIGLLYNSSWMHLPDYVYTREWMAWTNPRALASIALTVVALCGVFWLSLRKYTPAVRTRRALFWLGWGLLWALLVALPFAALAGRNPENRYTYIPSFGVAVAVAALVALLFAAVSRTSWRRIGQIALTLLVAGWMGVYAWITTSDVAEFGRAGSHARAFLNTVDTLPVDAFDRIALLGMPSDVGSAYVFATAEAFHSAMRLHGAAPDTTFLSGDLAFRTHNTEVGDMLALGYDRTTQTTGIVQRALLCPNTADLQSCSEYHFALPESLQTASQAPLWLYAQLYDPEEGATGGVGMFIEDATGAPLLRNCWQFIDVERFQIDPQTFDNAAVAARCNANFAALQPLLAQMLTDTP